jgi:hypothetical protein
MVMLKRSVFLTLFAVSPLLALAAFSGQWGEGASRAAALATGAGIVAYIYVLNLFILGTRSDYLVSLFGEEGAVRFHVTVALISAVLAAAHGALKATVGLALSLQVQSGQLAFLALLGVVAVGAALLLGPASRGAAAVTGRTAERARARLGERAWAALRHVTGAAVLVGLFHVLYASTTLAATLRTLVMGGWFVLALGAWIHHVLTSREARSASDDRVPAASRR